MADPFTACAQELAAQPELVKQLIQDHSPTAQGFCRAHDTHHERHPCSIRRLAELALASAPPGAAARRT